MSVDAPSIVTAALLAVAAWGMVRFVAQVDRLERRVDDCCTKHRRTTDSKPTRRR